MRRGVPGVVVTNIAAMLPILADPSLKGRPVPRAGRLTTAKGSSPACRPSTYWSVSRSRCPGPAQGWTRPSAWWRLSVAVGRGLIDSSHGNMS